MADVRNRRSSPGSSRRATRPRQLQRRLPPVRRRPRSRARASSASSTCTRSPSTTTRVELRSSRSTSPRCSSPPGSTPSARPSSPEPRDRARRGGLAALGRDELRPVRPHDAVQGEAEAQEFVSAALFTYPVLMAGDILLYQTDSSRSATTSASTSSSRATSPSASTPLRRDVPRPRGRLSRGSAAGSWISRSRREDVDDARDRAGPVYIARPAGRDPQEVQVRRHRLGARDPLRARTKARRLEPDRDHDASRRASRSPRSRAASTARATAT